MKKICSKCNKEKSLEEFKTKSSSKSGKAEICKACARKAYKEYIRNPEAVEKRRLRTKERNRLMRINHPEKVLFGGAKQRAKVSGVEFSIEIKDIIIPKFCPVLGIELKHCFGPSAGRSSPSLDRLDSTKGYIKENINVVSWRANILKNDSNLDELKKIVNWLEQKDKNTKILIVTNGCFRLGCHGGHLSLLEECNKIADELIVLVDDQQRVKKIKPGAFCLSDKDRLNVFKSIKYVDKALIFKDENEMEQLLLGEYVDFIKRYSANHRCKLIYVKGGDYTADQVSVKRLVESLGGEIKIMPFKDGYSTSDMIAEINLGKYT